MIAVGQVLLFLLKVYMWIVIASVVLSWLIAFEVVNASNEKTRNLVALLNRAVEPVFKPLRKYVPPIGGIDITPIIVLFAIFLLEQLVVRMMFGAYYPRPYGW